MSSLDTARFRETRASNFEEFASEYHSIFCDINIGAWVKCWLHCGRYWMSVSCFVNSEADCLFDSHHGKAEDEKRFWELVRGLHWQVLPKTGSSLVVLLHQFHHFYFVEQLNYLVRDWSIDLSVFHMLDIFAGFHKAELICSYPLHSSSSDEEIQSLGESWRYLHYYVQLR